MATGDLTDLDGVRTFLQKDDLSTDQDDILQALITAASLAIRETIGREFTDSGAGATRRFAIDVCDTTVVSLAPYDLQTTGTISVTLDPQDNGGTELAEWDHYVWHPQPAGHGVYTQLELLRVLPSSVPYRSGRRALEITGRWGFPGVPEDVKHWCEVTVATWLRKDISGFTNVFNLDEGRVERAAALPGGALAGLAHYRRC